MGIAPGVVELAGGRGAVLLDGLGEDTVPLHAGIVPQV
jgi:hypothetical protein